MMGLGVDRYSAVNCTLDKPLKKQQKYALSSVTLKLLHGHCLVILKPRVIQITWLLTKSVLKLSTNILLTGDSASIPDVMDAIGLSETQIFQKLSNSYAYDMQISYSENEH